MIRKLKNCTVLTLLLGFAGISFGQLRQEVTVDVTSPFAYNRYGVFYELLIKDNQGFSVGLAYDFENINFRQAIVFPAEKSSRVHLLQFVMVYKFYFSKKRNNSGFFLGPLVRFEIPLAEDKDLDELYVEYHGVEYDHDTGDLLKIGGAIGYKYVLKDKWVFEAQAAFYNYPLQFGGENSIIAIGGYFGIKAGYRF